MTLLRQRMLDDLKLRGLSESTKEAYVCAVLKLAEHYGRPPDKITDEDFRQYFLHLRKVRGIAQSTLQVILSALRLSWCGHAVRKSYRSCSVSLRFAKN